MNSSISPNHAHLDQTHGQIRLTLLAAILCIAALTWAFLRSAELSPAQHSDYTRQLRDLREVNALMTAWEHASTEARSQFIYMVTGKRVAS